MHACGGFIVGLSTNTNAADDDAAVDKMWRITNAAVNSIITQLSPVNQRGRSKKDQDELHEGLELSVCRPAAQELEPLSRHSSDSSSSSSSKHPADHSSSGSHPLALTDSSSKLPDDAQGGGGQDSSTAGYNQIVSNNSALPNPTHPKSFQAVLRRLVGQDWVHEAPAGARLVFSVVCWELQQQQAAAALRSKLQLLADADSWQAACALCQDAIVLRALTEHYCPAAATDGSWPLILSQQQQQLPQQLDSLQALFVQTIAAAVACTGPGSVSHTAGSSRSLSWLQQLEACVLLGEAVRLQQQQPAGWSCLMKLAACHTTAVRQQEQQQQQQRRPRSAGPVSVAVAAADVSDPLGGVCAPSGSTAAATQQQLQPQDQGQQQEQQALQQAVAAVTPAVSAWVDAVLAASTAQPQPQPGCGGAARSQLLLGQWEQLLAALKQLQQQAQEALPASPQHPLHPGAASPSPMHAGLEASESSSATVSSAAIGTLVAGAGTRRQQQLLLQELGAAVPALLLPSDLAGAQLPEHNTDVDSLTLVLLLRLAASTSNLWLQLLDRATVADSIDGGTNPAEVLSVVQPQQEAARAASKGSSHALPASAATAAAAEKQELVPGLPSPRPVSAGSSNRTAAARVDGDDTIKSPRSSWPDELLNTSQLWPSEVEESEDETAAITREERTLRGWINSVLHNRNAGSAGNAAVVPAGVEQQQQHYGPLTHSCSVDSAVTAGRSGGLLRTGGVAGMAPVGSSGGKTSNGPAGVFRCSSASAAAVTAQLSSDSHSCSTPVHSRSISADATGSPVHHLPLSGGSSTEPAAPSTLTAAEAATAAAAAAAAAAEVLPVEEQPAGTSSSQGGREERGTPAGTHAAAAGAAAAASAAPVALAAGSSSSSSTGCGLNIASVSSLFGPELRSGVLLLEILDMLQPGCVDWRLANRPPFAPRTAQLKALENCQLALKIAQEELGLPLVSMSPGDLVLGRRKIILALVYQLMRYNTMQLLESISAVHRDQQHDSTQPTPAAPNTAAAASKPTPQGVSGSSSSTSTTEQQQQQQQLPPPPPPSLPVGHLAAAAAPRHGSRVNIRSSSRKQRCQLAITEQDILDWANNKLRQVKPLGVNSKTNTTTIGTATAAAAAASPEVPVIRSFKDRLLGSGVVLLQLLHVLAPELVDLSYVTAGHTPEQRQSNARYALSLADKMGCSLFLVWEDLVDPPQPRMVLVLLASLMYHDLQRQQLLQEQEVQQQQEIQLPL